MSTVLVVPREEHCHQRRLHQEERLGFKTLTDSRISISVGALEVLSAASSFGLFSYCGSWNQATV